MHSPSASLYHMYTKASMGRETRHLVDLSQATSQRPEHLQKLIPSPGRGDLTVPALSSLLFTHPHLILCEVLGMEPTIFMLRGLFL